MIRLALRNLLRNRWRSGLTMAGVAVAVAMLIWTQGLMEAFFTTMLDSATSVELGDVRVESAAHARDGSAFASFPATQDLIGRVHRVSGVRAAAPRLLAFGLLGHGTRSQGAVVFGVDPNAEARASSVPDAIVQGAGLPSSSGTIGRRAVVLGEDLAGLLAAKVGDELVVMLQAADGSMGDDRLRVVGIVRTGVGALDRQAAWMSLSDVGYLAALDGQAHELMIRLERGADLERAAAAIRSVLAGVPGPKLVARTWQELAPELHNLIGLSRLSMFFLYGIVYFIAALGILNAQRMTALERKREMAVMMAVGVTPARLGGMILAESALLCGLGAIAGMLVGALVTWYHAHAGLDLAAMGSQGFSYAGVNFQSRIHFVLRPAMILWPAVAVVAVGVVCGLWPALVSVRLRLAGAIAGRN
jgi:ABC-type lipoprotein release transport system permease subunit